MKVNCLSCGHKVDLGDAYDDYAGPIKCNACHALLHIETEAATLRSVAFYLAAGRVVTGTTE